jgi:hypothetical protein
MERVDANLFPSASNQKRASTGRFGRSGSGQQPKSRPGPFTSKKARREGPQAGSDAAPTVGMHEAGVEVIPEAVEEVALLDEVSPPPVSQTRPHGYRELLIQMKAFSLNSPPGSELIELEARLNTADTELSDHAVDLIEVLLQYLRDT